MFLYATSSQKNGFRNLTKKEKCSLIDQKYGQLGANWVIHEEKGNFMKKKHLDFFEYICIAFLLFSFL